MLKKQESLPRWSLRRSYWSINTICGCFCLYFSPVKKPSWPASGIRGVPEKNRDVEDERQYLYLNHHGDPSESPCRLTRHVRRAYALTQNGQITHVTFSSLTSLTTAVSNTPMRRRIHGIPRTAPHRVGESITRTKGRGERDDWHGVRIDREERNGCVSYQVRQREISRCVGGGGGDNSDSDSLRMHMYKWPWTNQVV